MANLGDPFVLMVAPAEHSSRHWELDRKQLVAYPAVELPWSTAMTRVGIALVAWYLDKALVYSLAVGTGHSFADPYNSVQDTGPAFVVVVHTCCYRNQVAHSVQADKNCIHLADSSSYRRLPGTPEY